MIAVIFTACMISQPLICKEVELDFQAQYENPTPMQCMQNAMPELAKWSTEHPDWRVGRFKCISNRKKELEL